jgi:SAM-dependent methyltransferase
MWDQCYRGDGFAYGTEPNDFLVSISERLPTGKILCIAEGEGRNAAFLAVRDHDVTAGYYSRVGLAKANDLAARLGLRITTRLADLTDFDFERERWDGIVSIFCQLDPFLRRSVHSRIVSGLKPGGLLALEAYTPQQLALGTGGPPRRELLVTLAELATELTGLEFVIGRELERNVAEGTLHHGRSAVVQVLARKQPRR